jgi:hypothetical protein
MIVYVIIIVVLAVLIGGGWFLFRSRFGEGEAKPAGGGLLEALAERWARRSESGGQDDDTAELPAVVDGRPRGRATRPRKLRPRDGGRGNGTPGGGFSPVTPADIPAEWRALVQVCLEAEFPHESDLIDHMRGQVAGLIAYAHALNENAQHCLEFIRLHPAVVSSMGHLAEGVSESANDGTNVLARLFEVYKVIREWHEENPDNQLPAIPGWLGAEGEDAA